MKALYKMFMLLGIVGLMSACNEDPVYYELPDQPDQMHVQIQLNNDAEDGNLIKLTAASINDEALKLTWDAIPSDYKVTYLVRFYATNNKNEYVTEFFDCGENTSFSITHNDLNSIVAKWALPGDEVDVTAQVVGTVHNELTYIKPEVSTVEFKAIGWEKYPEKLYLHTSTGMSNVELTQRQLGTGVYEAQVTFAPCTYHFTTLSYADYPAYYMGEDGKLQYADAEGDNIEFENTLSGTYTIIVDVNDTYLDCRVLNIQIPAGASPSMVGDGCAIGWNPGAAGSQMTLVEDPRTPYIYSWTGEFYAKGEFPDKEAETGVNANSEGAFKVLLFNDYGKECFFAPENNANPLENHELQPARVQGSSDNKWLVPATGKYTFTINVLDMTTSFVQEIQN